MDGRKSQDGERGCFAQDFTGGYCRCDKTQVEKVVYCKSMMAEICMYGQEPCTCDVSNYGYVP